jgi:chromobox protein 1
VGTRGQSQVCIRHLCFILQFSNQRIFFRVSGEEILNEYFHKIGGRHKIFKQSDKAFQTRKRRRATNSTTNTTAKRLQGNEAHLADKTSPATVKNWTPPSGSWEDEIETIDACEDGGNGKLVVFLVWKNGEKTKHATQTIYKKCPQKVIHSSSPHRLVGFLVDTKQMLQFYERHIKIIRNENKALGDGASAF